MPDAELIILDGCTFSSRGNGDVEVDAGQGLFYRDVRHLSLGQVTLDGQPLAPLTSDRVDYYSARALGVPAASNGDQPLVSVSRARFVTEGVHEYVVVENLTAEPQWVRLEIAFGSDFADTMKAQRDGNGEGRHWQDLGQRSVTLWNERDGYRRGTTLTFSRRPRLTKKSARFDLELRSRELWSLCVDVVPIEGGERHPPLLRCGAFHDYAPKMPRTVDEWLESAPTLDSTHDTAIVAEGMRRYGFREEAARLGQALLDAAHAFDYQLPEVFGGFPRHATNLPVRYPAALTPQSWAAAAPPLVLRTLLGLDVVDGELRANPCLPAGLRHLSLSGTDVRGSAVDIQA